MASFTDRLKGKGVSSGYLTFTERIEKRRAEDQQEAAKRSKTLQGIRTSEPPTFNKDSLLTSQQQAYKSALAPLGTPTPTPQARLMSKFEAQEAAKQITPQEALSVNLKDLKPAITTRMPEPISMNLGENANTGGYLANRAISGLGSTVEGLETARKLMQPKSEEIPGLPPTQLGLQQERLKEQRLQDRTSTAQAGESKSGATRFIGNMVEAGTGMLPTIALSAASGGVMGIPFIMTSATGNSYEQARREGADHGQALKYGVASGLIEGAIEGIIGGIPGMKGVADPLIDIATRSIKSRLLKEVAKYGLNALGEGIEEALASAIDPLLRRGTFDETAKADLGEILNSFLVGTATSALMQAPSTMANIRGTKPPKVSDINFEAENPVQKAVQSIQQEVETELQRHTSLNAALDENINDIARLHGEQAQQELQTIQDKYNQAIEDVQNEYMTNELRADEAEQARQKYGLDDIVSRMEEAETKLQRTPEQIKSDVRMGLGTQEMYELLEQRRKPVFTQPEQQQVTPIGGDIQQDPQPMLRAGQEAVPEARIFGEPEIPTGEKERGFVKNIRTDQARNEALRQSYAERTETYIQAFGKETVEKAQAILDGGLEPAVTKLNDLLEKIRPESAPLSKMIADRLAAEGQVDRAREITSTVASRMTEAGQFTQAAILLRQADAATFLMTVNKQLAKLNEQGRKRYGKKWTDVDLTAEEKAAIEQIKPGDQEAYDSAMEQIRNRLANEMPSDAMEKFDAWRRMAMLLNPKTHIRNIGGNVTMMGQRKMADTIGAGLEVITDEIRKAAGKEPMERTKSVGWSFDKGRVDTVNKSWETVKSDMEGSSRWKTDIVSALGKEKRVFDNKFLQWLNDASFNTLNFEDNVFIERAYKDALGQYLKANKITEVNDSAVEYATRRALEATYRQNNKVADAINSLKRTRGAGKLLEAAIPFTKTPTNIAKTAFEYSPLGLSKTLFQSNKSPAAIIETISKGLTGTGIFGLGMLLKALGWAKGGRKRSEKSEALDQMSGIQQYSLITPQGSYTLDWAQPTAIPLFMGVSLMEKLEQTEDFDYDSFMDAAAAGGDTFFNMTMLQNVKRLLGGAGSTSEAILGLPWNYVQQAWPAVFGQAARTIDDTRRSTYDPNGWKQIGNTLQSKIPYIGVDWLPSSKALEPALDVWGQEQSQGGVVQQFISPGYAKGASDDKITTEVARLYDSFGDNDMLPKVAPKSFSADKVKYTLSAEQRTDFQRDMGQDNYNDIARLISTAEYRRMTDTQKVKKIKKIVNDNYNDAKEDIIKASALKGN